MFLGRRESIAPKATDCACAKAAKVALMFQALYAFFNTFETCIENIDSKAADIAPFSLM
jgi:hypothetical protein